MKIIKMSSYQKNDFERILNYAKKSKLKDVNNDVITPKCYEMDIEKINNLIKILNGNYEEELILTKDGGGFIL